MEERRLGLYTSVDRLMWAASQEGECDIEQGSQLQLSAIPGDSWQVKTGSLEHSQYLGALKGDLRKHITTSIKLETLWAPKKQKTQATLA